MTSIKNKWLLVTLLVMYLLTNMFFVDCYSMRVTEYHTALTVAYALFILSGILLIQRLQKFTIPQWTVWILLVLYITVLEFVQYWLDPMEIQVDRWSAIHYFLDNLFSGIYPYSANTHLGGYGSPFPVWQALHIPFWLIGNVGLSYIPVLLFFLYAVYRYHSPRTALTAFLLYACSPATAYEIVVRSDLLTNFLLVCAICIVLWGKGVHLTDHIVPLALLCGLTLSTRLTSILPLAMLYGAEFLRIGWKKQLTFSLFTIAIFLLTLLPFAVWNPDMFFGFEYTPFRLQTRQGNWSILIVLALAVALALLWRKDIARYYTYTALLLYSVVVVTFLSRMILSGDWSLYLSAAYDLTYFNMSLPFCIAGISGILNVASSD